MNEADDEELHDVLERSREVSKKLGWWPRFLLKVSPYMAIRYFASQLGIRTDPIDKLHHVFAQSNQIDFIPLQASRGFMIVIDGKLSLWFYQDGDHFKYDGFEMGEYDSGDVTIFDKLK